MDAPPRRRTQIALPGTHVHARHAVPHTNANSVRVRVTATARTTTAFVARLTRSHATGEPANAPLLGRRMQQAQRRAEATAGAACGEEQGKEEEQVYEKWQWKEQKKEK